jgi:hypothetical protein
MQTKKAVLGTARTKQLVFRWISENSGFELPRAVRQFDIHHLQDII